MKESKSAERSYPKVKELLAKANEVIVDKEESVKLATCCFFSGGHLLLEDFPGMGKTSLIKTFCQLLGLPSQRIQFTNDLLPGDIIGTPVFHREKESFEFHKGPIFSHFVLADEINRASPKTQSACLQAMEELKVSVDRQTYDLPSPFFLVATQNPEESVGTFQLPDSQLDRFLMRLTLGPPSRSAERALLKGKDRHLWIDELAPIFSIDEVRRVMDSVHQVHVSDSALDYLQDIIEKSRELSRGLSPRGGQDFCRAAKAYAFIHEREFVVPEDFQAVGVAVMGHRLNDPVASHTNGQDLANELINMVPVP